jgi:membrane-bound ClpP family serine protease
VTGIILIAVSLVLSMLPPGFTGFGESSDFVAPFRWRLFANSIGAVLFAFVAAGVGFAVLARYIKFVPFLGRVVMQTEIAPGARPDQAPEGRPAMSEVALSVGDAGVARTDLRPGGKALFGDRTVMVVADSEFIESGARVRVTEVKGKTVVVVRA